MVNTRLWNTFVHTKAKLVQKNYLRVVSTIKWFVCLTDLLVLGSNQELYIKFLLEPRPDSLKTYQKRYSLTESSQNIAEIDIS